MFRYSDSDHALYEKCAREHEAKSRAREVERDKARLKWKELSSAAEAKGTAA